MLAIRIMGGLGNMMFQVACGESWRKKGYDVVYTKVDHNFNYIKHNYTPFRNSDEYKNIFVNFDWNKYKAPDNHGLIEYHVPFVYTDIVPKDGVEYLGYFQSERNFYSSEFIKWLFEPTERVVSLLADSYDIFDCTTCSIHVRRQDYLQLSDYHHNLTVDYYKKAIWTLNPFKVDKFLVFSDDIKWCKETFTEDHFIFMDSVDYIALYQMILCDHNIIANSSLSWWGAYLDENFSKVIIAPEKWFGHKGSDSRDVIPIRWIKL